ncbi:hypothetical protein C1645_763876 [Glomus cerebriforme]|uniref:HMG box domain-containing protein n=1 Tax=Glomus cerebriforme TaxID=658196 RepID=A0A397T3D8_9GLOM|nr:hypothetical protein C1645_763876 [Glomus cerebriforme]
MSAKPDDKRLKLAAQGLRKTALSLQAAVVSLLQTADALTAETDDNLVENNPLDVNLQDLLKGDINGVLTKLFNDALNNEGEALYGDQRAQQNGKRAANGVKKPTRKPRPPRDPNAPTKPQNAFILFQKDIAHQVKAENTGKPWSEIVHLISTRWKALPKEEREVYERKFELAKQQFEADYKIYLENKDQDQVAPDIDGHEEQHDTSDESATPNSSTTASLSEDEEEEDTLNQPIVRQSRSKAKSNAPAKNLPQESSSKKRSKKRKPHEDDNESVQEDDEYESPRKSKKKALNEEGSEVQAKERKKNKKVSREEDKDLDVSEGGKSKKKKTKKIKQEV